ncbi:uncharacterized protein LOC117228284 [Megalopta genalis]|uniref:uncharacterized protein LOC117228284 n=1 Tax=Megalopta genalis TaxID=115081 RepID=UPI003FD571BC
MSLLAPSIVLLATMLPGSCIMVPQDAIVPLEIFEGFQEKKSSGDRGLIVGEIAAIQELRQNFSATLPCIQNYVNESISNPAKCALVIIEDEGDVFEIVHPLLIWLKEHYAFYTHPPAVDFNIPQLASSAIVVMSRGGSLLNEYYVLDPCDRGCLYVMILLHRFEDEETFLSDAAILSEAMWHRKLSIVATLGKVGDTVLVAGSLSFESGKICTPMAPEVLGSCVDGTWENLKKIGPLELNDCYLKIAYLYQPPYVNVRNGTEMLYGFEGRLIEEVGRDMNLERLEITWEDNASFVDQVKTTLFDTTKADLVIGRILHLEDDDIGYSYTYDVVQLAWLVPKIAEVSLKGLVRPFQTFVWAAIIGILIFGGFFKVFMVPDVAGLDIFAMIIGVPVHKQPTRLSRRIHFIAWSIFGLFLTQLYIDSLADQLINQSNLKIETTEELAASNIKIAGTAAFKTIIDSFDESDEFVGHIKKEFVELDLDLYIELFGDILEGKNTTFAVVVVLNSSRSEPIETSYAYTMTTDVICSFPLSMATWKGFPLMSTIDTKILLLLDYGMFDYMVDIALGKDIRARMSAIAQDKDYKTNLHLQQFVPVFLTMAIGFVAGSIVLILEIILHPWKGFE